MLLRLMPESKGLECRLLEDITGLGRWHPIAGSLYLVPPWNRKRQTGVVRFLCAHVLEEEGSCIFSELDLE